MYTNESIKMTRLILGNKKCPYVCTQPVYIYTSNCVYPAVCGSLTSRLRHFLLGERACVYVRLHVFYAMALVSFPDFFSHAEGISSLHMQKQLVDLGMRLTPHKI